MLRRPAILALLALSLTITPAQAADPCQFMLGFKALADAIPDAVGQCTDNAGYAPNGDAVQHTTTGLMVWREADNVTAFTNGYWTWLDGPYGVQGRLNTDRFEWETEQAPQQAQQQPPTALTPTASPSSTANSAWQIVRDVNVEQERAGVVVSVVRAGCMSGSAFAESTQGANLGSKFAGTTAVLGLRVKVSNDGKTKTSVYPKGIGTKLVSGSEQVAPETFLTENLGGELYPGVVQEGQIIFYLKRQSCPDVKALKYVVDAPYDGVYRPGVKNYEIDFRLQ